MKPTLEELEKEEAKRKKEQKRVQLAISLDICPVCSSSIIRQDYEKYDKPKGWWIFKSNGYKWDYRKVCMKDPLHYEDKENYYTDY